MKKYFLIFSILMLLVGVSQGKNRYKITLEIEGNRDTAMLLGYYYAQNTYAFDTAYNNGKGRYVFEGDKEMLPGLYFFTPVGTGRYVDFVVYHEKPNFQFRTSEQNWVTNMSVKGSKENEVFFNYQRVNERLHMEWEEARQTMDSASLRNFEQRYRFQLDSIKYWLLENKPNTMVAKMVGATREVEVPIYDGAGRQLTQRERFDYYMQHCFDYVPLDDNFIIRTPRAIFYQKVMDYVNGSMQGMPPSLICPLLDSLIDRSEPAPEVFKWLVHTLTEKYLQSNVMVYDEVYVHLVKRYFAMGKVFWAAPTVIDEQVERAEKWEHLLVGKTAPELVLFDTARVVYSLHHMPGRYTLLLFWSPTCGHCREIVPELYREFEQMVDSVDLSAFAILTEPDDNTVAKWKRFLDEHGMKHPRWVNLNGGEANVDWREVYDVSTTPQVYLIDNQDHTFVAKKFNGDVFKDICDMLLRSKKAKQSQEQNENQQ